MEHGVKVYRINDYEWIAARSLEEGLAWYLGDTGLAADEAFDSSFRPTALTNEEMAKMVFVDSEGDFGKEGATYSFKEALDLSVKRRQNQEPFSFAGTEW